MLNKVVLIGRLTRDPELRYTANSNVPMVRMGLAVERPFTNQQGERSVDFIDIVCWRQLAETCSKYLQKGRLVAVSGRLEVRSYEAQDGQKRRVTEVVADEVRFLDSSRENATSAQAGNSRPSYEDFGRELNKDDDDNDLPF